MLNLLKFLKLPKLLKLLILFGLLKLLKSLISFENTTWVRTNVRTDEGTGELLELLSQLKIQTQTNKDMK